MESRQSINVILVLLDIRCPSVSLLHPSLGVVTSFTLSAIQLFIQRFLGSTESPGIHSHQLLSLLDVRSALCLHLHHPFGVEVSPSP